MKILLILVCVFLVVIIKIMNMRYIKRIRKDEEISEKKIKELNIISPNVSYDTYDKVSKRASVSNMQFRKSGDFLDFFISNISNDPNMLENNILIIE